MRKRIHGPFPSTISRAATIALAAITSMMCLTPESARAQRRDWTSRFLPRQSSSEEDEGDELEERERGRYYRNLVRDENDVRQAAEHLRRLARNAGRFSSGAGSPAQQTAFAQLLQQVGARADVAAVLHEQIPELDVDNFTAEPFCEVVQRDGELVESPLVLQQGRAGRAYASVQTTWSDVANSLTTAPPTSPDVARFSGAVNRWESAHRSGGDDDALTAGGLEVHAYFSRLDDLLRALGDSEERAALSTYLLHSGYPFAGGTVGDLVQHVLDHELNVRIGSPAHVVLANLTQEMLLEAEADLAVLEDRIEYYKQQSLASEGGGGGGFRRGQSGSDAPSLPRREPPGSDEAADTAPPMQRVADDPWRRRGR